MARIIFNNTTDYDVVLSIVERMYSDVINVNDCSCDNPNSRTIEKASVYITAAYINKKYNETERFKANTKAAYLLLINIAPVNYSYLNVFRVDYGYFNTDTYQDIQNGFLPEFEFSKLISKDDTIIEVDMTISARNKYIIIKVPTSIQLYSEWKNTDNNFGTVGDSIIRPSFTKYNYNYYMSRNPFIFDTTNTTITLLNDL